MPRPGASQSSLSVIAGITTGLVGFLSSFAIVIAMMQNFGATDGQIVSGLLVVCFAIGIILNRGRFLAVVRYLRLRLTTRLHCRMCDRMH